MRLDVVEILRLGLSGLTFLLAVLGYRLVSQQPASTPKDEARKAKLVSLFTWQLVALVVFAGIFSLVEMAIQRSGSSPRLECRRSLTRLDTLSKISGATADDLRGTIASHVAQCRDLLQE